MYASAPQSVGYLEYTDVLQFVFKYITSDAICVLGEIPIDDDVVDCIECTCLSMWDLKTFRRTCVWKVHELSIDLDPETFSCPYY